MNSSSTWEKTLQLIKAILLGLLLSLSLLHAGLG